MSGEMQGVLLPTYFMSLQMKQMLAFQLNCLLAKCGYRLT